MSKFKYSMLLPTPRIDQTMNRILAPLFVCVAAFTTSLACADKIDFEKQVHPLFIEHCSKCHGEKKGSAKLRLHTVEGIRKKWKDHAELIVAGKPKESDLYKRLVLPIDDKKRMPKGADPLSETEIKLIHDWIEQGATFSVAVPADGKEKEADDASKMPAKESEPLPEVVAASPEAVEALTQAGALVLPLYADSHLLQVSFAYSDEPADDADVALLVPVAEQLFSVNLSKANVSADGCAPLASCKNLRQIHLENSSVTDGALVHLSNLAFLTYVNLYGTEVTDAGLDQLSNLSRLEKLFVWKTKASYEKAMALQESIKGLTVSLGYDHPVIALKRLTKEKEQVATRIEEAKAKEESAKKKHESTLKYRESLEGRAKEIEESLKKLNSPESDAGEGDAEPAATPADSDAAAPAKDE